MRAGDRRAAILAAARILFAESGFHGAGTAAIARAAGCSEAILYRHFASKRALLLAVLENEVVERLQSGRAIAPPPGPGPASLAAVLETRLHDGEMVITIRLILLAIGMSGDPEIAEALRTLFSTVRAPLRQALESEQRAGRIRDDIDPELLTWLWHGLFLVAGVRNSLGTDDVALQAVDAARVLSGLLAPSGS